MEQCTLYNNWQPAWDQDPILNDDYTDMAAFIYRFYDSILRAIPPNLPALKKFVATGELSLENDLIYTQAGINREIGRRIIRWLEAEPVEK